MHNLRVANCEELLTFAVMNLSLQKPSPDFETLLWCDKMALAAFDDEDIFTEFTFQLKIVTNIFVNLVCDLTQNIFCDPEVVVGSLLATKVPFQLLNLLTLPLAKAIATFVKTDLPDSRKIFFDNLLKAVPNWVQQVLLPLISEAQTNERWELPFVTPQVEEELSDDDLETESSGSSSDSDFNSSLTDSFHEKKKRKTKKRPKPSDTDSDDFMQTIRQTEVTSVDDLPKKGQNPKKLKKIKPYFA